LAPSIASDIFVISLSGPSLSATHNASPDAILVNRRDIKKEQIFSYVLYPFFRLIKMEIEYEVQIRKATDTSSDIADLYHSFERYSFVVTMADKVIGFVSGAIRRGHGHISGLAVYKGYRMKGIGKRLLKMVDHEFLASGFDKVTLEVRKSNWGAIKFYKKQGYKRAYPIKGYYADGEDAIVYEKKI
jgi:ribosomal-protein-alanine N-acetyltransferase